jgi:ankyrin repeat protein
VDALLQQLVSFADDGAAAAAALAATDASGLTALAAAARAGWPQAVRRMLQLGANPAARLVSSGNTAAHLAALGGHLAVLRELLPGQHGGGGSSGGDASGDAGGCDALVNRCNNNGDTPLMFACSSPGSQAVACVALLLNRGADPHAPNRDGLTAAMVAAGHGRPLALAALVRCCQKGGGEDGSNGNGSGVDRLLGARDTHGNGPLAFASRSGELAPAVCCAAWAARAGSAGCSPFL